MFSGLKMIIAVGHVQQNEMHFRATPPEAVSRVGVQLPEIVAGFGNGVTAIVLLIPPGIETGKEAGGMIEERVEVELLERACVVRIWRRQGARLAEFVATWPSILRRRSGNGRRWSLPRRAIGSPHRDRNGSFPEVQKIFCWRDGGDRSSAGKAQDQSCRLLRSHATPACWPRHRYTCPVANFWLNPTP